MPVRQKGDGLGGGKKGRSGRKRIDFLEECSEIADNLLLPKLRARVASHGCDDEAFRWAAGKVLDYAKSKAPVRSEVTGKDGGKLIIEIVRDPA